MTGVSRRSKKVLSVPLSSMADIAFLLLIFFMLSSISGMEKEVPVNLPESIQVPSHDKSHFNIFVKEDGGLFFDNKENQIEELVSYARYRKSFSPKIRAMIHADSTLPYNYVNQVLESLKEAGLYNIVLASKKATGASK